MDRKLTKTKMLESMKPGEDAITLELPSTEECSTYSSLACRFNRIKAERQNKYIHVSIDYPNQIVHIVCTTYDEYLKEKYHELPRQWWKERIRAKKKSAPTRRFDN